MRRLPILGAVLAAGLTSVLAAQAPRVTPAGDPSVRSDSIYALAVDPAAYPDQAHIFLLDDGIVRLEADGRATRTYRQVVQILTQDAVETFSEESHWWSPDRERFRLNWVRVLRLDGTVISEGPAQSQESDMPVSEWSTVYSARKQLHYTLSGVAPGTIVDYSYTTEETKAWLPGDLSLSWGITTGVPVRRSRYVLDAPAALRLRVLERNLNFRPRRETARGRVVTTWAAQDVPVIKAQSFSGDSAPRYMSLWITGPTTWSEVGTWYGGMARDRYALGPAASEKLNAVVAGAASRRDTVRLLHRFVAQDIRYVSIALGQGGYQPRAADETVRTGFGDCKDKATLFVAALRQWGIPAATVLLSSAGAVDPAKPTLTAFDHAIARVQLDGSWIYTDLTADLIPFGEIPMAIEGSLGVVVPPTGPPEEIRFPTLPVDHHLTRTELVGTLDTLGRFSGLLLVRGTGQRAISMRSNYQSPMDSAARATFLRRVASNAFEGARGDSLQVFDGRDLQAEAVVRIWISNGRLLRRSGRSWVFPNPLGTMASQERTITEIETEIARDGGRWAPIDLTAATGHYAIETLFDVRLPAGWQVELPPTVRAEGVFGLYEGSYSQQGDHLVALRRFRGATGNLPADRVGDLLEYLRTISADNAPYLTVSTGH